MVVTVGAGPIGLAAILTARPARLCTSSPSTKSESHREAARQLGADIIASSEDVAEILNAVTGGMGADVVMEALGIPETLELCTKLVRPGGHVANIGLHGKPATLHLEDLWIRNITITTGLVDTFSTPTLLRMLAAGQLGSGQMVTHHFALENILEAYDVFSRPAQTGALKVVLTRQPAIHLGHARDAESSRAKERSAARAQLFPRAICIERCVGRGRRAGDPGAQRGQARHPPTERRSSSRAACAPSWRWWVLQLSLPDQSLRPCVSLVTFIGGCLLLGCLCDEAADRGVGPHWE